MESVLIICPIASAKQANRFTLDPRWTGIRTGATYRFWTRHALLLVKTRFLRPRNGRSESAIWPGKWPRRCPQPRAVRVRSGDVSSPQPGGVRVQSVTASAPVTCPWAVRGCHRAKIGTVRELSAASPQSRGVVCANRSFNCRSPVLASIYCSPHPAALQIDPPPGSGNFASMISRPENCFAGTMATLRLAHYERKSQSSARQRRPTGRQLFENLLLSDFSLSSSFLWAFSPAKAPLTLHSFSSTSLSFCSFS